MKKWDNVYLIKLSPDRIIDSSATTYRKYYEIGPSQRFVPEGDSNKADTDWGRLKDNVDSLGTLTMRDKLIVVAHGSDTQVGDFTAEEFAKKLIKWGLKEVGLITFKSCNIGRGNFLEDFVAVTSADIRIGLVSRRLKVGWVKGYRGTAMTLFGGPIQPVEMVVALSFPPIKTGDSKYKLLPGAHASEVGHEDYLRMPEDDE